jgi:peptidoglycan/xylan/chitin deacetylase (PgdA/CDA1 family)
MIGAQKYTDPLVGAYCLATMKRRRKALAEHSARNQAPVMALFYHRVADEHLNPWTIRTDRFLAQMEWIRQRFEVVSLIRAQQLIGSKGNDEPVVCITFDDGYADNCRVAVPWLIENKLPFTYFVTTRALLEGESFDHDLRRGRPLAPNTPDQIREMATAGVEIGAHTRTHADLGPIDDERRLYDEIVTAKRELESVTGRVVRYFAFPFGKHANMSPAAFRLAFQAGYWGVCSAYGGYNLPGDDPFHLQRFHGDPGWGRFCNWMTYDLRKQRRTARFNPGEYRLGF